MLNLPVETLRLLGNYLDHPSLISFSSTNRQCRLALLALVFRDVCIKFSSPATLNHSIERCREILASAKSFRHVQNLRVVAAELYPLAYSIEDCGDWPLDAWRYCAIDQSKTRLLTRDDEWRSLIQLVQSLPALRMVTWGCLEQIPPCILDIIDEKTPTCWLDMDNFRLTSLVRPSNAPLTIDGRDLKVATARCLRSLSMRCELLDSFGYTDYSPQAVMEMVSGEAPNLRTVRLLWPPNASKWASNRPTLLPGRNQESEVSCFDHQTMGHLDNLEIVQDGSGLALRSWDTRTDFGLLQSLKVHYPLFTSDFIWLKDSCQLRSLHTLAINLGVKYGENNPESDLADAVDDFLLSIPPLRSVKLTGRYSRRIVESVLDRCSLTLRHLLLGPLRKLGTGVLADIPFIQTIQTRCPNLEELAIPLMRCQGNASEVAVYRSLAQIPAIRKLHLSMYSKEPFLWDQDWQARKTLESQIISREQGIEDQFRRAVTDLAVDQALAGTIFQIIASAKDPRSPALECLEVHVSALQVLKGFDSDSKMTQWLQYIGRSWTCTLETRDGMRDSCRVDEYDDEDRLCRQDIDELGEVDEEIRTHFGSLLAEIWPGMDSENWRTQWHSFPLSV